MGVPSCLLGLSLVPAERPDEVVDEGNECREEAYALVMRDFSCHN